MGLPLDHPPLVWSASASTVFSGKPRWLLLPSLSHCPLPFHPLLESGGPIFFLFLAPCLSLRQPNPLYHGPQLTSGTHPPMHSFPSSSIQGLHNFLPSTHLPRLIYPSKGLGIPQTLLSQLRSLPWPGGSLTSSLPTETLPILQGSAPVPMGPPWSLLPGLSEPSSLQKLDTTLPGAVCRQVFSPGGS